ncbi:MAG: hypothetical protein O3B84_06135, partial [Chloroflexi bacterium]|nr:hypothetical protein [Chloroflexota bacterium]
PRLDYRAVAIAAMTPDLIDKPLFVLLPQVIATRSIAHTVLFTVAITLALYVFQRRWSIYGLMMAGHLLLDLNPRFSLDHIFWPLFGVSPSVINLDLAGRGGVALISADASRLSAIGDAYVHVGPYYLGAEAAGLLIVGLLLLQRRIHRRGADADAIRSRNPDAPAGEDRHRRERPAASPEDPAATTIRAGEQ